MLGNHILFRIIDPTTQAPRQTTELQMTFSNLDENNFEEVKSELALTVANALPVNNTAVKLELENEATGVIITIEANSHAHLMNIKNVTDSPQLVENIFKDLISSKTFNKTGIIMNRCTKIESR